MGTLGHILNNCPKMLDRYEWRHNGVLAYLYKTLIKNKQDGMAVYADIEGGKVNGGTIPPNIMVTTSRPDLVIVNENTTPTTVIMIELTIPFTNNIDAANSRKRTRYEFLTSDIEEAGFKCSNIPLEVGSRGYVTSRNKETLVYLCHLFKIRKFQQIVKNSSKLLKIPANWLYLDHTQCSMPEVLLTGLDLVISNRDTTIYI